MILTAREQRTAFVRNLETGALLGDRLRVAATPWARLRGLLRSPEPRPGEGLLIEPCNGIHTVGMAYPIDVVFVSRAGVILRCDPVLPPGRFVPWVRRARCVLELPAGTIEATGTSAGDRVAILLESAR